MHLSFLYPKIYCSFREAPHSGMHWYIYIYIYRTEYRASEEKKKLKLHI